MKRNLLATFALAVAAMAASSPAVLAQHSSTEAKVPFAFQVGKATLPAGTYVVNSNDAILMSMRDRSTGQQVLALGQHEIENTPRQARLIFHRYGDKYFLAEFWGGAKDGMKLHVTKQEQEYRASAKEAEPEQNVLLAMN